MFPVTFVVIQLFRKARPRRKKPSRLQIADPNRPNLKNVRKEAWKEEAVDQASTATLETLADQTVASDYELEVDRKNGDYNKALKAVCMMIILRFFEFCECHFICSLVLCNTWRAIHKSA